MNTLFIVLSAAGTITSLVLILFLFRLKKGNSLANTLLGVLFLFLTIRIGKATLYYYFDLNALAVYIGLAAFVGIGPTCYLYFRAVMGNLRELPFKHFLHLGPPLIVLMAGFLLSSQTLSFLQPYLYEFILGYYLLYLGFCYWLGMKNGLYQIGKNGRIKNRFLRQILGTITLIYIVYTIDWLVGIQVYIFGGLFYAVIIYLFLYKSLVEKNIYHDLGKVNQFQYINEEVVNIDEKIAEVDTLMVEEKLYLNSDLNIENLCDYLKVTRHQLSELINSTYGSGFPAYVNSFRLAHAKRLLSETENNISEIAYASGFNSISTFNSLFKKKTGITPTQFRKKNSPDFR